MNVTDLEVTDRYRVRSHGNGTAIEICRGGLSKLLMGDDASAWYNAYVDMCHASLDPKSIWFNKTWNECLDELCDHFLEVTP